MSVNGINKVRCPYCQTLNVSQTSGSKITHAAKGAAAYGMGSVASFLATAIMGNHPPVTGKIAKGILSSGSYDFECNSCGANFVVEYEENTVTRVKK